MVLIYFLLLKSFVGLRRKNVTRLKKEEQGGVHVSRVKRSGRWRRSCRSCRGPHRFLLPHSQHNTFSNTFYYLFKNIYKMLWYFGDRMILSHVERITWLIW